jgi:hypothetical protein
LQHVSNLTGNVQRAKLVLLADVTNLLITRRDYFDLQHEKINITKELEISFQINFLIINTEKIIAISFHSERMRVPLRP